LQKQIWRPPPPIDKPRNYHDHSGFSLTKAVDVLYYQ
jgi:hypothetical protein